MVKIGDKKAEFLKSIKGNKLKFKRYTKQPLRYPGGKSLAVGEIISYIPNEVTKVVSPFAGGLSVEYAIAHELGVPVDAYDIFEPLINFYQELKDDKLNLIKKLEKMSLTETNYKKVKERLKIEWESGKHDKLNYAADFFFNFGLSYGPGFLGWVGKKYLQNNTYSRLMSRLGETDFSNMNFGTKTFEEVIPKANKDFLFLDPPYFLGGTSKMFAGIYPQRNFPIYHNNFDHEGLARMLKKHKGGFLLTYNDCKEIRDLYKGYKIIKKEWQYTMGQGEKRIGKNRINNHNLTNKKESSEIFIVGEIR